MHYFTGKRLQSWRGQEDWRLYLLISVSLLTGTRVKDLHLASAVLHDCVIAEATTHIISFPFSRQCPMTPTVSALPTWKRGNPKSCRAQLLKGYDWVSVTHLYSFIFRWEHSHIRSVIHSLDQPIKALIILQLTVYFSRPIIDRDGSILKVRFHQEAYPARRVRQTRPPSQSLILTIF